ncbi:glycerol-3-phosphate acyltransferase 1, mitochondrial isoform X1 [Danaus plexippus]|nr:glycerol-3-phosphate acyltransferase 1, mitochondrial isoform X1 [Danaus plexippus]XP_032523627.2 glycerol-3-phosphate acyltransferase 1, mitochondrial isoform X1 [Danaus plexippus]XP_061380097.1 glycerol-3-phosphate acyltransferase 1, mitochondrial isoform X1 [Danaus plexippus]XP_061380098.1 glycerol-3-phosphate acyltransferase 1, mitochondrial isoform X1 [Danaus plexippus]XP_061380099.1 glycerol-3-phosphate acyltransferase 1, mitochondrial isoform X1 [Danaus plexippus]XP_061380100.1 glyce
MDTMLNVWTLVEQVRVAGAAELAIFTAILYWFFTSSRVADMLEVVGERVGGWCGRDPGSLRQAVRRKRHNDVYSKIDAEFTSRTSSLYRLKEEIQVPPPQPEVRPPAGLACSRCAPLSRDSWKDPRSEEAGNVINILNIGRQTFANGGVVSRYLCDLAQCVHLINYDYKDVLPNVSKDKRFIRAIEDTTREELKTKASGTSEAYDDTKKKVESRAMKVLRDISSAMSNNILKLVAWLCHKAIRRIARGGCGTRASCVHRLRRAKAAGLPLVFVPLHRSHFDYVLVTFTLYLTGLRPPLVAAGDNMRIPFFGWFLRACGAFFIRRRVDGSEYHGDPLYKTALRAYILNSLAANNNLEFFIEGGRTRTGKPQLPKAGILSVIMDAYLDGTIDDALLVPVTLNYDKLVDGNFVREQLGMPKQMETFWSALRGIWMTLNTNHGSIRVDFNQPISLKELVTSFQRYNYLKAPIEAPLKSSDNLAENLDRQILYNHSHSSLYGNDVSTDHKMMVEAIGRHLVYDAAQSTALMCTNVVSYVLLTEQRQGCSISGLQESVRARGAALRAAGRDLGYSGETRHVVARALETLGTSLVRCEGSGAKRVVKPQSSVAASLELSYYANAVVAHYAASAIVATALESIIRKEGEDLPIRHSELMEAALELSEILSQEFILCAPCKRIEERLDEAVQELLQADVLINMEKPDVLEEERWARRFAKTLEDEDDASHHSADIKYTVGNTKQAVAERARLLRTIRPLLEAYSTACRCVCESPVNELVKTALDSLLEATSQGKLIYGEAVSTDAIRNCLKLLRQWGVIEMYTDSRVRKIKICPPYTNKDNLDNVCANVYKFNMDTPLV